MTSYKVISFSGAVQQVDYTPSGAVSAGDVIVINGKCYFAQVDIAAGALGALTYSGGTWKGNKSSGAWAVGDRIYWNPTGTPNVGTASSGAFNNTGVGYYVGDAIASPNTSAGALTGDQFGFFAKTESGGGATQASTVAAAGSTQADAASLQVGFNLVTGADGTKGAILPAGAPGRVVYVKNADAANAILKVYPPTGGTINALSANAAISMALKTAAVFICGADGVAWYTIPLLPS